MVRGSLHSALRCLAKLSTVTPPGDITGSNALRLAWVILSWHLPCTKYKCVYKSHHLNNTNKKHVRQLSSLATKCVCVYNGNLEMSVIAQNALKEKLQLPGYRSEKFQGLNPKKNVNKAFTAPWTLADTDFTTSGSIWTEYCSDISPLYIVHFRNNGKQGEFNILIACTLINKGTFIINSPYLSNLFWCRQ